MNSAVIKMLMCALLAIGAQYAWAQSTIVYVPGPAFWFPWSFGPPASLDMNQDAAIDFTFAQGASVCTADVPPSMCEQSFYVGSPRTNAVLKQGYFAASVPSGEWIGGSPLSNAVWAVGGSPHLFIAWSSPRNGTSGVYGPIGEEGEGYIGVRFSAADGDHYGWIHVQGSSIVDWAYETRPNQPIRAGARPVPVPLSHASVERPGFLRLVAETENGKTYQVQTKENLLDSSWSNLSFALPANSTNAQVDIPMMGEKAFYRVVEAD